jgi:hypothetical protein
VNRLAGSTGSIRSTGRTGIRTGTARAGLAALALCVACEVNQAPKPPVVDEGEGSSIVPDPPLDLEPVVAPQIIVTPPGVDAGPPNPCGNGVIDQGEVCDTALSACCNATCDGATEAGTRCRAAEGE